MAKKIVLKRTYKTLSLTIQIRKNSNRLSLAVFIMLRFENLPHTHDPYVLPAAIDTFPVCFRRVRFKAYFLSGTISIQ